MKPIWLVVCGAFLGMACNDLSVTNEQKPAIASDSMTAPGDSLSNIAPADSVPKNIQIDSVIYLAFAPDSISVAVKGHLDKRGDPVVCYLPIVQGKKLAASVIPDKAKASIRFSHIYLPDGKSDGPFGTVLKYNLTQKGMYKIYISPNMMAGDPVSSDFILKVKVE